MNILPRLENWVHNQFSVAYCMSKKSWHILYSKILYKMRQGFFYQFIQEQQIEQPHILYLEINTVLKFGPTLNYLIIFTRNDFISCSNFFIYCIQKLDTNSYTSSITFLLPFLINISLATFFEDVRLLKVCFSWPKAWTRAPLLPETGRSPALSEVNHSQVAADSRWI